MRVLVLAFCLQLGLGVCLGQAADPAPAVRKALPFISSEGQAWREDHGCASCHQIPSQLWSETLAQRAGFPVDANALSEQAAWARDWRHWMQPDRATTEPEAVAGNIDTMAQLLLVGYEATGPDSWIQLFQERLLSQQEDSGAWKPCGQLPLQRRPARETQEATTMWVLIALAFSKAPDEALGPARARALAWMSESKTGLSTEWWAVRLLLRSTHGPSEELDRAREDLLTLQHPDGSWGWLTAEPGDALATGLALYALGRTTGSTPEIGEAAGRALQFLTETQGPDGSWPTPSSRTKDKRQIRVTSTYWGTAWAVIGMLEADRAGLLSRESG